MVNRDGIVAENTVHPYYVEAARQAAVAEVKLSEKVLRLSEPDTSQADANVVPLQTTQATSGTSAL